MSYLMYDNKPHKITNIVDQGPGKGNVYHLEGGKKVHQNDLDATKHYMMFPEEVRSWHQKNGSKPPKELDKADRIEVTADGKKELDVGKEPLDKQPSMMKSIKERWNLIKKAISHEDAFMDIAGAEKPSEQEKADAPQPPPAAAPDQGGEDQGQEQGQQDAPEGDQVVDPEQAEQAAGADPEGAEGGEPQEGQPDEDGDAELIQALKDHGYSDAEIAHVVHGHSVPTPSPDDIKAGNLKAQGQFDLQSAKEEKDLDRNLKVRDADHDHEHKKRMKDLEYEHAKLKAPDQSTDKEHKKRMLDLEYDAAQTKKELSKLDVEHAKRMKDLEFEAAKREKLKEDPTADIDKERAKFEMEMERKTKELELEYKKKELELNLKLKMEQAKIKNEMQKEQMLADHEVNTKVKAEQAKHKVAEAKKPPKKEPAGKSKAKEASV